jgi:ribulose-phosphate 3-epimerase
MDGHFVPPITFGPIAVEALRDLGVTLDVHLMIERPEEQIEAFAKAGAHNITFHAEASAHVHRTLDAIRGLGCRAGLAVNPGTPPAVYGEVTPDIALCMTVNPGWGGQRFIGTSLDKVRRIRALIGDEADLEVDGGVDTSTIAGCAEAGATLFVAGSAVFSSSDPGDAYRQLSACLPPSSPPQT